MRLRASQAPCSILGTTLNTSRRVTAPLMVRVEAMTKRRLLGIACLIAGVSAGTAAAQEIPAGWSVETKPKGAILTYAPEADGPRYLIVACLRDTDELGVYSTGIGAPSSK